MKKTSMLLKPNKYKNLENICSKLITITHRLSLYKSMGRPPTYLEDLDFYSIIIPDLLEKVTKDIHPGLPEKNKKYMLSFIISEWIEKNTKKCAKYIKTYGKDNIKSDKYTFNPRQSLSIYNAPTINRKSTQSKK